MICFSELNNVASKLIQHVHFVPPSINIPSTASHRHRRVEQTTESDEKASRLSEAFFSVYSTMCRHRRESRQAAVGKINQKLYQFEAANRIIHHHHHRVYHSASANNRKCARKKRRVEKERWKLIQQQNHHQAAAAVVNTNSPKKKSQKISFTSQAEAIHTKIKCAVAVIAICFARYFLQLLISSWSPSVRLPMMILLAVSRCLHERAAVSESRITKGNKVKEKD